MFATLGMRIVGFDHNTKQVGRGSLRVYATSKGGPQPNYLGDAVVIGMGGEMDGHLSDPETYVALGAKIIRFGEEFRHRLVEGHGGMKIVGYGAAAKTTTFMHVTGLDRRLCEYLVDDSPWKQGLYSPGLHIPIVGPDVLKVARPDAVVIYAWNFAESILAKYKGSGIRFIIPLPSYREVVA
jgi:hypothetical protein